MTVADLIHVLAALPDDLQSAEVYLTADGELDAVRVVMIHPVDADDMDDISASVVLAGDLAGMVSRYAPTPAQTKPCICDDTVAWERRDET